MPEFYTTPEAAAAGVHPVDLNLPRPLGRDPFDLANWSDPDFVAAAFDRDDIARVTVEQWPDSGGASSDMHRMYITTHTMMQDAGIDGKVPHPQRFVLKMTRDTVLSKDMALTREALFLMHARHDDAVGSILPSVSYCQCDTETGRRTIAMPFVDGVQVGHFFGKGSPLNWTIDLDEKIRPIRHIPCMNVRNVTFEVTKMAATLHARFWNDKQALVTQPELLPGLGDDVLRGRSWLRGHDEASWQIAIDKARGPWLQLRDTEDVKKNWDSELVALLDVAYNSVSWAAAQAEWARTPMTLVHGDFHPANMIALPVVPILESERSEGDPMARSVRGSVDLSVAVAKIVFVDWEMVGVGSGPQELGQFLISHADPDLRRQLEGNVLAEYAATLQNELRARFIRNGELAEDSIGEDPAFLKLLAKNKATMKDIRHEYIKGGIGKWLWFLPLLAKMMPGPAIGYFTRQVTAFMKEHLAELGDTVILPRV